MAKGKKKGGGIIDAMDAAEPPSPKPPDQDEMLASCPVQPLGTRKGIYFYISSLGEVRELREGAHRWQGITSLFGGDAKWLFDNFPTKTENIITGWQERKVGAWLMKQCSRRGLFDPAHGLRGPGIWRVEGGGLVVHCGNSVFDGSGWRPAGIEIGDVHYPAYPAEPRPDFNHPATAADAAYLHDHLAMWNWRNPPGATRLVHGWLMCAMICGALDWRPHIWISGDIATGKSALERLLKTALGGERAIWRASDVTEAGIRMGLDGAAKAVLLDEIEPKAGSNKVRNVVELSRLASTDEQGAVVRGSTEGLSRAWHIRGCFYFTSVIHAPLRPADKKRICVIDLDPLPAADDIGAVRQILVAAREKVRLMAPGLRARMILGYARFLENLAIYDLAMGGLGQSVRHADQLGTILAAHDTALYDDPVTLDHAVARIEALDIESYIAGADESAHADCLSHLLSTSLAVDFATGGTTRMTIGEMIGKSFEGGDYYGVELRRHGLATRERADGRRFLLVARRHRGLNDIFANTDWEGGAWSQLFARLRSADGKLAETPRTNISFAGAKERAVWIPFEMIEEQGRDEIE